MHRVRGLLVLALLLIPGVAHSLQLHWSSGADTLTFTEATRAILLLRADSAEVTLPPEWRLLWVGDSTEVEVMALDSLEVCAGDTAQVYGLDGPATPADSAAHLVTVRFCSGGSAAAEQAVFQLDLPAWGRGKCKVVALDPADSTSVLESNEVTFNGGVADSFPTAVLLVERSHLSTELDVAVLGSGLSLVPSVQLSAPDASWHLPLQIAEQSETRILATGRVAADLPASILEVSSSGGMPTTAAVEADAPSALSVPPACVDYMKEIDIYGVTDIQPKDFTIVTSRGSFHIFYTRHDMKLHDNEPLNEKTIGHQRSRDLNTWFVVDKEAVHVRPGQWDSYHVWAPSILKKTNDITYYMFYVGVDSAAHEQRIGVATSTDLNIWHQDTTWVYSHDDIPWAVQDPSAVDGKQLRDPFVVEVPESATDYLMYFVTVSEARRPRYVVGVARSTGNLRNWTDDGALWNTDAVHSGASILESPHAWQDNASRWNLYYTGAAGWGDSAFVWCQTNDVSPFNPDSTTWSASEKLYKTVGYDDDIFFWHGSEYLKTSPRSEYLLAYDDDQHAVAIAQVSWRAPHSFMLHDSCPPKVTLDVPGQVRNDGQVRLTLLSAQPSCAPLVLQLELVASTHVEISVFDVAGRRVRPLLNEVLPAGPRELHWDLRGGDGRRVGAGVYFVRAAGAGGKQVARVVVLR